MSTIKLDSKVFQALEEDVERLLDEKTMLQIHNELARFCDPYVPFLYGPLSQTVEVDETGVTYIQPYARYQYHGEDFNHTLDYHPLATAYWDQAMLRDKGDQFTEQVARILERRANEIYG